MSTSPYHHPKDAMGRVEVVWSGTHRFQGRMYDARLFKVQSRKGARRHAIDQTLLLTVHPERPTGAVLVIIDGARGVKAGPSFETEIAFGDLQLKRFLDAGYVLAFVEYRGSKRPGLEENFTPPLPIYGDLIFRYDTDEACEYAGGDVADALSATAFAISGSEFPVDPQRLYLCGGSHGGYLALHVAHEIPGFQGVVISHPVVDIRGSLAYLENPPSYRHPHFRGQSPAMAFRLPMEGTTPQKAFLALFDEMGDSLKTDASLSVLQSPPLNPKIFIFHGIDDWLVSVANSRWYVQRWRHQCPELLYVEFLGKEIPTLFPASADALKTQQLLSTHVEQVRGSVIEDTIHWMLGLHDSPTDLPASITTIRTTALQLSVAVQGESTPLSHATVTLHDYDGWAPFAPIEAQSDALGVVRFDKVPLGYTLLDIKAQDGQSQWQNQSFYVKDSPEPQTCMLRCTQKEKMLS
jgi:acetyl esterase/lipase